MRIGFAANWCNRGQGVIARQIRSIFDEAGHETFVLARPTNPKAPIADFVDTRDEWDAPNVTAGSTFNMEAEEYVDWARRCRLDVLFCDMNLQFDAIAAVREAGVRTVGRFVWERFVPGYVKRVQRAYDVVYSVTRCEQQRYREYGLETPYVRYGLHPDLLRAGAPRREDAIYFIFHGGLQGKRKPIAATIKAFKAVKADHIRLIIKSQGVRETSEPVEIDDDPRIAHIVKDMAQDEYHALFSSCHVCLSPSRWEGLGVHLFESIAHGLPVISNNIPPINEVIRHGVSGLLVKSVHIRDLNNGLPIYDPDPDHLIACIKEMTDRTRVDQLIASTRAETERFAWEYTRQDYLALAAQALAQPAGTT
jgi:glycosyltransferase involved in cell wall biosynthesis